MQEPCYTITNITKQSMKSGVHTFKLFPEVTEKINLAFGVIFHVKRCREALWDVREWVQSGRWHMRWTHVWPATWALPWRRQRGEEEEEQGWVRGRGGRERNVTLRRRCWIMQDEEKGASSCGTEKQERRWRENSFTFNLCTIRLRVPQELPVLRLYICVKVVSCTLMYPCICIFSLSI